MGFDCPPPYERRNGARAQQHDRTRTTATEHVIRHEDCERLTRTRVLSRSADARAGYLVRPTNPSPLCLPPVHVSYHAYVQSGEEDDAYRRSARTLDRRWRASHRPRSTPPDRRNFTPHTQTIISNFRSSLPIFPRVRYVTPHVPPRPNASKIFAVFSSLTAR